MNSADEKTGDARRAERHFSRSCEQCAAAEDAKRENPKRLISISISNYDNEDTT